MSSLQRRSSAERTGLSRVRADHNSGWREDADAYDGLNLPDDDFNYDDFARREFGSRVMRSGVKMVWWIAGILLIAAFILMYFVYRALMANARRMHIVFSKLVASLVPGQMNSVAVKVR